jgi:two-component system sensor histidine kinase YesM
VGRLEEDRLAFYISDNGVGIPEEQRACLLHDGEATGTERYGIRNVDQRIRIHHGDDYGVTIQSTVGVGTTITVTQPAITG